MIVTICSSICSRRCRLAATLFGLVLVAVTTAAAAAIEPFVIVVDNWNIPAGGGPLPSRVAAVGDTASFSYKNTGHHSVFLHPSGDCNVEGSVLVGYIPTRDDTDPSYTFTEDDVGDVFFACHSNNHCQNGVFLKFTVTTESPYAQIDVDNWQLPENGEPLPPRTAVVGDVATFSWNDDSSNSNRPTSVFRHPSKTCNTNGSVLVGSQSGAQYRFTANDVGEVVFVSHDKQYNEHCESGFLMHFYVYKTRDAVKPIMPAPTEDPTRAPTRSTPSPTRSPTQSPNKSNNNNTPSGGGTYTSNGGAVEKTTTSEPTQPPALDVAGATTDTTDSSKNKNTIAVVAITISSVVGVLVLGIAGYFTLRNTGAIGHKNTVEE